jgi:hypothetical protein
MADALFTPLCVRMLADGHAVRFRAPGFSMHPSIRDGEWMTVEPAWSASVRRGDVLLYRSARGLTAHRVRRIVALDGSRRSLVFGGDNSGDCEERVAPGAILGRVVCVERDGRRVDPNALRARMTARVWHILAGLKRGLAVCLVEPTRTLRSGLRRRSVARQGGLS